LFRLSGPFPTFTMSNFINLVKALCGVDTRPRFDGRLCPTAVKGWIPVALAHDRRLSAGIFKLRPRSRWRKAADQYRLVAWRTYSDRGGRERATTFLHRDEIDPALNLLAKCGDRMPPS
jgi:hypothetical protein